MLEWKYIHVPGNIGNVQYASHNNGDIDFEITRILGEYWLHWNFKGKEANGNLSGIFNSEEKAKQVAEWICED